jgi:MFS family permease
MTDDKGITIEDKKDSEGGLQAGVEAIRDASVKTVKIMKEVFAEKEFWTFMFMLATLIGVRLVFLHFHYTFPKYGIRVLGEGAKVGTIYGVLNPVVIVFLVPLVSALTKNVSSYRMMMIGTFLSAGAVIIVTLPEHTFEFMNHGWMAELVYDRWLHVPTAERRPLYMGLVLFIFIFTIGEAFWSPRLMQFTAAIAPKGREGTYISLAMLPMFAAKFVAGPMSGWLVSRYTPVDANGVVGDTSHHYMVWVWIGGMAITSPIFLVVLSKIFLAAERRQQEEVAREKAERESQASS